MIIDAHQHFWKFDPVRDSWISADMKVIRKDFLPAEFHNILRQQGVDGSVVVQSDQSEEENTFQLHNADQNDFIKGVVGWVDLQAVNLMERLLYFKQFPKMKGFRHVLQGEADRALMLKPAFKRGIGMLNHFDFSYDILIYPDQLKFTKELVAAFPDQRFVIDHLAKPEIKKGSIDQWRTDMKAIAALENVSCKISGMVTEADWNGWKRKDFAPYMDVIVESFGVDRIMYGSDYPVCLVAASYEEVLSIVKEYFSPFTAEEKEKFFALNAVHFYKLNV